MQKLKPKILIKLRLFSNRKEKISFVDAITHTKEDTRYRLEIKPWDWRNGALSSYFTGPVTFLAYLALFPILLGLTVLAFYSFFDPAVTFLNRKNIHPQLKVQSSDYWYSRNHFLKSPSILGQTYPGVRDLFHWEIEQALQTREEEKLQKKE